MESQVRKITVESKTQEEAMEIALQQVGNEEKITGIEMIQKPSNGFFGIVGVKDGVYEITVIKKEEVEIAKEFVENILVKSKINAIVNATKEGNLIKISIEGKEATCLIGRRGETLVAVQFLTGLALNKLNKDSHMRVLVDIENYRSKREESLVRYARKVAREVAKTRKTKKLDYMNPYERRIIHSALQNDKYVFTHSEGTDPYRRLVIEYKR